MTVKRSVAKLVRQVSSFGKSEDRQSGSRQLRPTPPKEQAADKRETMQRSRAGWAVIEEFECDGFRYRLTRRPAVAPAHASLTRREREALAYALRGYKNKSIAEALGLAPSTVGVLLSRAASKLGTKSRGELLMAYAEWQQATEGR